MIAFFLTRFRCCLLFLFLGTAMSYAERYVTLSELQASSFPEATRFAAQELHFTAEEAKAIERESGVKVRKRENRIWVAQAGQRFLGVVIEDQVLGKHEVIDYAVVLSSSGAVLQIEILQYREKYGAEIRSPKWRSQFAGKTAASPLKFNEDIYNISGATISCKHVTEGIKRVLATYALVGRARLLAAHGLSGADTIANH